MDNFSSQLNVQYIGCSTGDVVMNHMLYSDDIALFASSAKGLQELLAMCSNYGCSHAIQFNRCNRWLCILTLVNLELLGQ